MECFFTAFFKVNYAKFMCQHVGRREYGGDSPVVNCLTMHVVQNGFLSKSEQRTTQSYQDSVNALKANGSS